jgi:hypothetical protein
MATIPDITVNVRLNNTGVPGAGFGLPLVIDYSATLGGDRIRYYRSVGEALDDGHADDGATIALLSAIFNQEVHPVRVAVGRGLLPPTQRYAVNVERVVANYTYRLNVFGEGFAETDIAVTTTSGDLTFVDGDVTVGTDTIAEAAHGMVTGAGPFRVSNAGGALPAGLAADTDYWIIAPTTGTYKLASSRANALALTPVDITAAAGGGTHTLRRVQNDVIVAQLVQALNDVVANTYTAAQVVGAGETDTLTVTADAAGAWFSLAVPTASIKDLGIQQNHADPGVATDLAELMDADGDWYAFVHPMNSKAVVLAAAAWAEANARIYYADSNDTDSITTTFSTGVSTDTLAAIKDLGYRRTLLQYHHIPGQAIGAALAGYLVPLRPGRWTAKYKTLVGISPTVLTTTHLTNLEARRGNAYVTRAGRNITINGQVANTTWLFLDNVVRVDWLVDDLSRTLFGVLSGNDIVSMTDDDIQGKLAGGARGTLARAIAPNRTVFRNDPEPTASFPTLAEIDDADQAARQVTGVVISGELAGAVHGITVDVVATF